MDCRAQCGPHGYRSERRGLLTAPPARQEGTREPEQPRVIWEPPVPRSPRSTGGFLGTDWEEEDEVGGSEKQQRGEAGRCWFENVTSRELLLS